MKKSFYLLIIAAALVLTACSKETDAGKSGNKTNEKIKTVKVDYSKTKIMEDWENIVDVPYEETHITPSFKDAAVEPDFSNLQNRNIIKHISDSAKKALLDRGFFISIPESTGSRDRYYYEPQFFTGYDSNEYYFTPNFITTDSVIHLYHVFYDNFLRDLEQSSLYDKLAVLNQNMLKSSIEQYNRAKNETVKGWALRNIAYFQTVQKVLGLKSPEGVPEEAAKLADQEFKTVNEAQGEKSAILNIGVDGTQFIPRGHYTRSEKLKQYFKSVMYYGQMGFFTEDSNGVRRDDLMGMAMLMTLAGAKDKEANKLWADLYDPISFLVDSGDDHSVRDYGKILYAVMGENPDIDKLSEKDILDTFFDEVQKLQGPKIAFFKGHSFRFMPQRAVLDNIFLQQIVEIARDEKPSRKPVASGVELMGLMGQEKAAQISLDDKKNNEWPEYADTYKKLKEEIGKMDQGEWKKSLYRGWLWTLNSMNDNYDESYPRFMQSEDYKLKELNTQMGSWGQLKHDTILYAKAYMAEMGGEMMPKDQPHGYVEPNVKFYDRLIWLVEFTEKNLQNRSLMSEQQTKILEDFSEMLTKLRTFAVKELSGENLSDEEFEYIRYIGGRMETLFMAMTESNRHSDEGNKFDNDMATVADTTTVPNNTWGLKPGDAMEIGVGNPAPIYAVYTQNGEPVLGKGFVFTSYEFFSGKRLTDEEWKERLASGNNPEPYEWIKSLILKEANPIKIELYPAE